MRTRIDALEVKRSYPDEAVNLFQYFSDTAIELFKSIATDFQADNDESIKMEDLFAIMFIIGMNYEKNQKETEEKGGHLTIH
jgi:hypothetical protein